MNSVSVQPDSDVNANALQLSDFIEFCFRDEPFGQMALFVLSLINW